MVATFGGSVSAQAEAGETVTVTVTNPDASTETILALTSAGKTYSAKKAYSAAGTYKARAHGDKDAMYTAWDSDEKQFVIALTARTGTLQITLP